jgi:hypothetical protein
MLNGVSLENFKAIGCMAANLALPADACFKRRSASKFSWD